jgi:cyclase
MLTRRIIPCLDVKDNRVVKGINFLNLRDAGDPVELGARYSDEGADELVFLDITATIRSRKTIVALVEKVAENVFIPFTVGGGISTVEQMDALLRSGAEKVVLAIDARRSKTRPGKWIVTVKAGTEPTDIDAVEWAARGEELGAGEILLTSMDADGTKAGYDNELNKAITDAVNIPVIASGGAGTLDHLYDAIVDGHADAVLMASITHFGNYNIRQIKEYLRDRGIPMNL